MSTVSIIVPIYNSKKTLARCIRAILDQSFQAFELLLCDDGSSDESLDICREFAKSDQRIRIFPSSHRGVSAARNTGLSHASGQYILFADSDDVPYPDWIFHLLSHMEEEALGVGGYSCIDGDRNRSYGAEKRDNGTLDGIRIHPLQFMEDIFSNRHMYQGYLWNKIFDAALIREKHLRFREGIAYNEDRLFVFQYLLNCRGVIYSNIPVYYYYLAVSPRSDFKESYMTEIDAFQMMCRELYRRGWLSPFYYALKDELRAIEELLPLAERAGAVSHKSAACLSRLKKRIKQCLNAIPFSSWEEFIICMERHADFQNKRHVGDKAFRMYQDFLKCAVKTKAEPMDYLKYRFYRLETGERDSYLTRREYAGLCGRYNEADTSRFIRDKQLFSVKYKDFLAREVVTADETDAAGHFRKLCRKKDSLVFKPISGGYGKGVRVFSTQDKEVCAEIEEALKYGGALVEERIMQHNIPAGFHPQSVNTIRSVTALSSQGVPLLIAAALRTGVGEGLTDNGTGGGIFANIDIETGVIDRDGTTHFGFHYAAHPDTETVFRGTAIPHWDTFRERSLAAALVQPGLRLCCWDWAITSEGKFALLEGNVEGGLGLNQAALQKGLKEKVLEALL